MASSPAAAVAMATPWGDMKLSGRKIKERFYTQVEPPVGAESDQPHFRCRCGKVRIQSLKHGYTNLKQHVMLKHPNWLLECADEVQATPPASPKVEKAAKGKGKAAAAVSPSVNNGASNGRKKRRMSGANEVGGGGGDAVDADEDAVVMEPPLPPAKTRRARGNSAASAATAPTAQTTNRSVKKRADYIAWDDYFMSVAFLSAMRSKDPSTQVGACIVNAEKKIVGIGYNGFPNGCSDDTLPWTRESKAGDPLDTKYPFVCHAEMNAILNKNASDLKGCTIYVALFPCNECAKLIIQSGIRHIVFLSDKYHDDWKMVASRRMLDMAGVDYRQHHVSKAKIVIDFSVIA